MRASSRSRSQSRSRSRSRSCSNRSRRSRSIDRQKRRERSYSPNLRRSHSPVRQTYRRNSGRRSGDSYSRNRRSRSPSRSRSRSNPRSRRSNGYPRASSIDRGPPSGRSNKQVFQRNRFRNDETEEFFYERKKEREALAYSIWNDIPSPPPPKIKAKKTPVPRSPSPSNSSGDSYSSSGSESDSSDDSDRNQRKRKASSSRRSSRKSSSKKHSSRRKESSRRSSKSSRSKKHKKKSSRSSRRKSRRKASSSSSESSENESSSSGSESDNQASRNKANTRKQSLDRSDLSDMDEDDRVEAEKFKAAVQGPRDQDDDAEDIGPQPLPETEETANAAMNYGKALLPGEGAAIAQFVQKNMRIPRRGEVGWNGQEIENLENLGYVMSGSRHKRMNAIRIRKENQVYTAEEKRALALINFEEKQQRENSIMNDFKEMLTERLTKKHGARLVEDMETSTKAKESSEKAANVEMTGSSAVRVGVIGGGAAGIIAAKVLRAAGHHVIVIEKAAQIGGVWKYEETTKSDASMYKSLRTNLPTSVMQLEGFPFPPGTRSFPSHVDVLQYLQNYARHYKVDEVVRLNATVTRVFKVQSVWKIGISSKDRGDYEEEVDKVLVCNGHFSKPSYATINGLEHFRGTRLHSHDYREPKPYINKRVLLIGRGPSGQDISLELANAGASEVVVSCLDFDTGVIDKRDTRVLKPEIDHIASDGKIMFTDGSTMESPDVLMYCTGYLYSVRDLIPANLLFPNAMSSNTEFNIPNELIQELAKTTRDEHAIAPLYKHLFAIEDPDVAFIGLLFSNLPFLCFELQAKWIAQVYSGAQSLPSKQQMYTSWGKEVSQLQFPLQKLHRLGSEKQRLYFNELAQLSKSTYNRVILEMYDDAGYLRSNFPLEYREAEYTEDPETGKWVRRLATRASGTQQVEELVQKFD